MRARRFGLKNSALQRGFGCWMVLAALASFADAGVLTRVHTPEFKADLTSAFEGPIPGGYIPMILNVENRSPVEQSYRIWCRSEMGVGNEQLRLEFSDSFVVAARSSQSFEVMVPVVGHPDTKVAGYYYSLQLHGQLYTPDGPSDFRMNWHGDTAAVANSSALDEAIKKHLGSRAGKGSISFSPVELSSDWRAFVGVKDVFLFASEWQALSEGQRTALLQWAAFGGRLNVQTDLYDHSHASFKPFGNPKLISVRVDHGLGVLRLGYSELEKSLERAFKDEDASTSRPLDELQLGSYVDLDTRSYLGYQLAVVAFVICIGPLNVMYLCRAPHRLRLFFTTPLIAAAFSALVLVYALARDGIGGEGHRFTLSIFMPEMRTVLEAQAQASTTGMLIGREFSVARDAAVLPLAVLGERFSTERLTRSLHEDVHSGDWFRSRWGQGQLILQASPTRERLLIEISNGGKTLRARSEINANLVDLYYTDDEGGLWTVARLGLGESQELKRVTNGRIPAIKPWHQILSSKSGSDAANPRQRGSNTFVALMESVGRGEIETLASIDWKRGERVAVGQAVVSQAKSEGDQR